MVQPTNTGLKDVQFKQCKLVGFDFSLCQNFLFEVAFENCQLDYAMFVQNKMKKTVFINCSMLQADFTECDLTEVVFDNCTLTGATFFRTNLEKADFRTAIDFSFDPDQNRVKKAPASLSRALHRPR